MPTEGVANWEVAEKTVSVGGAQCIMRGCIRSIEGRGFVRILGSLE